MPLQISAMAANTKSICSRCACIAVVEAQMNPQTAPAARNQNGIRHPQQLNSKNLTEHSRQAGCCDSADRYRQQAPCEEPYVYGVMDGQHFCCVKCGLRRL